jgi:hypothetical protein
MITSIPSEVVVWRFGGKTGNLKSQNTYVTNGGYNLFCNTNKKYLTYGKEPIGINLVWANGNDKKIHLRLPDNKEREILTGEPVALGIGGGEAFLHYGERTMGIDLNWEQNPFFEWYICGADAQKGKPISEGSFYAIVNSKVKPNPDFLVYLDRIPGQADVGWTTSPNWPGKVLSDIDKYKGDAAAVVNLLS